MKVITVLGPTAIGKSDLAVDLAIFLKNEHNLNCEVISADSRQVYKGLDIGTGKITKEEMKGIFHHMLDVIDPGEEYSVFKYTEEATKVIEGLVSKNITPIICGGTGLYINGLLFETSGAGAKQNPELREKLERESLDYLQNELKSLAEKYNADISKIDIKNKRRVIRAIEIITELKYIPEIKINDKYENIIIGLDTDYSILQERIKNRIDKRLDQGMIQEVENLLNENKVTHERLQKLGLEYKFISDYLTGTLTLDEFKEKLYFGIIHYAKRQKTWFRNNKELKEKIAWFDILDVNFENKIKKQLTLLLELS